MSVALLLGLFLVVADAHAARLEVCAFSFHGPPEIQVFKERLPAEDFDVIDLSPYQLPVATPKFARRSWRVFQRAIDPLGRPRPLPQERRPRRLWPWPKL